MPELSSGWVGSDTDRVVSVEDARAITSALITAGSGIRSRGGFLPGATNPGQVAAAGTPNATVTVNAFQYVMPNSRGLFPYIITLDSPKTIDILTGFPADPSNSRHDLIVAQQSDAFYLDADNEMVVRHVVGTPSSSPTDPTVTGSPDYKVLARIVVTAGALTITNAMITDLRAIDYTVGRGGIVPVTSSAQQSAMDKYDGLGSWRMDNDTLYIWNGSSQVAIGSAAQTAMVTDHETRLDALEADTGLITLPATLGADWDASSDIIQYRLRGKSLFMHAQLTRTNSAITAGATGNVAGDPTLFTISTAALRPLHNLTATGRGTVTSGMVYIQTDGVVKIGDLHSGSSIAIGEELRFSSQWLVA